MQKLSTNHKCNVIAISDVIMKDVSTYIVERVDNQILWYSKKSRENKQKFHMTQIIIIISSSIVPLINVIDFLPIFTRIISAILGTLITIITSITQLKKYEETWLDYRRKLESLRKEKNLFVYDAGGYTTKTNEDKSKLFVQKVEAILESGTEMAPKKMGNEEKDSK